MKRILIIYCFSVVVLFVVFNFLVGSQKNDPKYLVNKGEYNFNISKGNDDWGKHYQELQRFYSLAPLSESKEGVLIRDDKLVMNAYKTYLSSDSQELRDIGHFGMARYQLERKALQKALDHLRNIHKDQGKYINGELSIVFFLLGSDSIAKYHFELEKEQYGFENRYAYYLVNRLFYNGKWKELKELFEESRYEKLLNETKKRVFYYCQADIPNYLINLFQVPFMGYNFYTTVVVFVVWFIFLILLSIFREVNVIKLLLFAFFSLLISFFTLFLYDFMHNTLEVYRPNRSQVGYLFSYCIFGIGLIEELIKLIPVLIFYKVDGKNWNPIDFIIYGGVSGLVFACIEDYSVYFDPTDPYIFKYRAFMTSFGHIFMTSICSYSLYVSKRNGSLKYVVIGVLSAIILHGLYDFFIFTRVFVSLSYVLVFISLPVYTYFINNTLNVSSYFGYHSNSRIRFLTIYLLTGFTCLVFLEYITDVYNYGLSNANSRIILRYGFNLFLIAFFTFQLSRIDLVKGLWFKASFVNIYLKKVYNYLMYKEIYLVSDQYATKNKSFFPIKGKIIDRLSIDQKTTFFHLELEGELNGMKNVILKIKDSSGKLGTKLKQQVLLLHIRTPFEDVKSSKELKIVEHALATIN